MSSSASASSSLATSTGSEPQRPKKNRAPIAPELPVPLEEPATPVSNAAPSVASADLQSADQLHVLVSTLAKDVAATAEIAAAAAAAVAKELKKTKKRDASTRTLTTYVAPLIMLRGVAPSEIKSWMAQYPGLQTPLRDHGRGNGVPDCHAPDRASRRHGECQGTG